MLHGSLVHSFQSAKHAARGSSLRKGDRCSKESAPADLLTADEDGMSPAHGHGSVTQTQDGGRATGLAVAREVSRLKRVTAAKVTYFMVGFRQDKGG